MLHLALAAPGVAQDPDPRPRATSLAAIAAGRELGQYVGFDGIVREVVSRGNTMELLVFMDGVPVLVVTRAPLPSTERLLDAAVRFRGTPGSPSNTGGFVSPVRVDVPVLTDADIITPPAAKPFEHEVSAVRAARHIATVSPVNTRVRIRGTVILRHSAFTPGRRILHVEDGTGAMLVEVAGDVDIATGEGVDVSGFVTSFYGTPMLTSALVRHVGPGVLPAPAVATAADVTAGRFLGTRVRLRGIFVRYERTPAFDTLTMNSDGSTVTGYLFPWPAHGPLPTLRQDSIIELTGIAQSAAASGGPEGALLFTLGSPEDIALIQAPSLWTTKNLIYAGLGAALVLLLGVAWIVVLNERVNAQRRTLEQQFEQTAALQRRWADFVASASDVIVSWDLEGRILSINATGQSAIGLTEEQAKARNLRDIVSAHTREVVPDMLRQSEARAAGAPYELELVGTNNRAVPLEITVQPMFDNQRHVGFQGIGRNVAAHKQMETALRNARDAAEDANRAKSEFLANMSHEIRTPMNGIIGMTELALTTELSGTQREYLDTVKSSAESLLGLLNSILDFSKIESRKLEIESVPFALRELVAETVKPLGFKADEKGLELLVDIAPDAPDAIVGDPLRFRQIMTNLISNAIKFTDKGHVLVEVREEERFEGGSVLRVSVTDTGLGIPKDKHPAIFEPFSQADGSTTRRFGGTGLGLAISATLVHLMGGRIWVESDGPGSGSVFHFTVRCGRTAEVKPAEIAPLLLNLPVLVVDDNAVNRRILADQLARWGMRATLADGGVVALAALCDAAQRGTPYRLVLLDANMPEVDGFGVAERIGERPELAGATIMMLTSAGHYGDAERCKQLNISAYLTKPIAAAHLLDAICRVLGPGVRAIAARAARPATVSNLAATKRRVLLAEDNIVNQKVAVGLLAKRGHDVTVVANGLDAVDRLMNETFDVVLMDVQMPVMDGLEATAAIRQQEAGTGARVRIVAMTAHTMNGDRDLCLAAGMDGYLSKPVNPSMLYSVVEDDAEPIAAAAEPVSRATVDDSALLERLGGDQQLFTEVIQSFLDDCPSRLTAIREAVERRDASRVRIAAHALKGAAGNLSATGLFDAAKNLEELGAEGDIASFESAWHDLATEASQAMSILRQWEVRRLTTH
jgi:PAS domain S-box-containing protein